MPDGFDGLLGVPGEADGELPPWDGFGVLLTQALSKN